MAGLALALVAFAALHVVAGTVDVTWAPGMSEEEQAVTIHKGQELRLIYGGYHNVAVVPTKLDFDECANLGDWTIVADETESPYILNDDLLSTLAGPGGGVAYFACRVGGHCRRGQKIRVTYVTEESPPDNSGVAYYCSSGGDSHYVSKCFGDGDCQGVMCCSTAPDATYTKTSTSDSAVYNGVNYGRCVEGDGNNPITTATCEAAGVALPTNPDCHAPTDVISEDDANAAETIAPTADTIPDAAAAPTAGTTPAATTAPTAGTTPAATTAPTAGTAPTVAQSPADPATSNSNSMAARVHIALVLVACVLGLVR